MNATSSDSSETEDMLHRAQAGDSQALERLFDRHTPALLESVRRRLAPRLRPRIDPSDVVQETRGDVFRRLDDFLQRRPMPFRLWLLKTAHERLVDIERAHLAAQRSVHREVSLPDRSSMAIAARLVSQTPSPSENLMRQETSQRVRMALARLPEGDREILMLRTFEGLSNTESAMLLDLKPETTKKRFTRAILRLKGLMDSNADREPLP